MEEKDFETIIAKVSSVENVVSAYICSRAGNFVAGSTPKFADRGMYSAITSLAYGTAEPVGHEMNDYLSYVSMRFTGKTLLVIGRGPRPLRGVLIEGTADPESVLQKVRPLVQ